MPPEEEYEIITVDESNIDTEHICCAIGNDKKNQIRSQQKKDWMKPLLPKGLVFKKVNIRGKAFVEFLPAKEAWKPIQAPGYNVIHCLWVSGRYKKQGLGKRLLEACLEDSKEKNGVAVITGKKKMPFLTDRSFFRKHGFETVDTAAPNFELMVKKFRKNAPDPVFREGAKNPQVEDNGGITFLYAHQCPYTADWMDELAALAEEMEIPVKSRLITSRKEAQEAPTAFPTFTIFWKGKFETHVIQTTNQFRKLVTKLREKEP